MERVSIVALLALALGATGCNCCRRSTPAPAPVAVCQPQMMQCDPCAPQGVTYGTPGFGGPSFYPQQ
jgi:hypothetical protein